MSCLWRSCIRRIADWGGWLAVCCGNTGGFVDAQRSAEIHAQSGGWAWFDYLALDTAGNVWILGGYTEDYEGGVYTNVDAAFLGRPTGGEPGILMPATVTMATPRWYIGTSGPEETPSEGEPVAVGLTVKSMMIFDRNIIMLWMFGGRVIDEENR